MTIDGAWIQSLKNDVPVAFSPKPPFSPQAVFIDGQIKLCTPLLDHTQTWDEYVRRQFLNSIQSYFTKKNVDTVILAFDNYAFVPAAKGMTQAKRRKYLPSADFHSRDSLPPTVPKGLDWTVHLSNRDFKARLIDFVIYFTTQHLVLQPGQHLIIDYNSHPKRYDHLKNFEVMDDFTPLGEADIKFTRYTALHPRLQVDSIDGDSVPIALMHLQKMIAQGITDTKLSILRIVSNTGQDHDPLPPAPTPQKKQKVGKGSEGVPTTTEETAVKKRAPRAYEFMDINAVYHVLVFDILPQCINRATLPQTQGKEINLLIALIGLSGTDFTRKLPGITGKTLYEYLPMLWLQLSVAYDASTNHLRIDTMLNQVVGTIYKIKFKNHLKHEPRTLAEVLSTLTSGSKLSEKTKQSLPSVETIACTIRNINWLMQYWTVEQYPDPVPESGEYGFKRTRTGAVDYVC